MNERDFCYWLQGYFEIAQLSNTTLSPEQVRIVRDHLQLVFEKVTSERIAEETIEETRKSLEFLERSMKEKSQFLIDDPSLVKLC